MFRLSTVALLGTCSAFSDETSLMQGLKPPQEMKQGHDKKKAISNLLSTATSMLKNGATPDVIDFASATLAEIATAVIPAIQSESDTDQDSIMTAFAHFERILGELEDGTRQTLLRHEEERHYSNLHKECRAEEGQRCDEKRSCDYDLYCTWQHFKQEEEELRDLSVGVHNHFCAPDANGTLQIFREHSVGIMPPWIEQKPVVEYWETAYDSKRPLCEELFIELDAKTAACDALQTDLEAAACQHRATQHQVRTDFNSAWDLYLADYAALKVTVLAEETDRWNEFKTLKQVQCLLDATTGYNGRPCDETTVNSVQTDCESIRPQCTRNSEGIFGRGFGSSFVADDAAVCDLCQVVNGDIDISVVRDRSDTLAEYQGLCNWFPTPPQPPCLCDAPYNINDGRCDPNPPPSDCDSRFHAAEYSALWMPPMPDFHANQCMDHGDAHSTMAVWDYHTDVDESGNSHCNPRPECQTCQPGSPVDISPQRAQCGSDPSLPAPAPAPAVQEGEVEYIGCFVDDPQRDMGTMLGSSYTFATCRAACGENTFMSLQYGGECFCANEYGTGPAYVQVEDENCNVEREPCSSNSHNCGGTWHQAIYQIRGAILPTGWSNLNENWNCGGTASSDHEASHTVTTNVACAEACYGEGYPVAAFWHNGRNTCRCYESCEGGGPTVMPAYPNIVMQKVYHLAGTDQKCPHQHEERLFRSPESGSNDITLADCHIECRNTASCAHFSFGEHDGGNVCMGCTTLDSAQGHVGFNTYDMERSIPVVQMLDNWDFEGMTTNGVADTLLSGKWIHFRNNGNSGLTNPAVLGWQQMGEGAGASGLYHPPNNEIAEGSHVLFLNSGDDSNYVYQTMTAAFTADMTIRIEAGVGGGNGGSDGGYRMGLYSEDGALVQEVAAGVNGAPDTSGSQYITTYLTVAAADHPDVVGQHLQLRLMKNKGAQGHYHYIRFT